MSSKFLWRTIHHEGQEAWHWTKACDTTKRTKDTKIG